MSVENMVFENHQTPETEMVRRHRITAAEMEFENGDDSDKFIGPFLDAMDEKGA